MEFNQVISTRRSIRVYQNRPISDRDLEEIILSGLSAPSAVNLQPWYFVVIRSKEQMEKLAKIMGEVSKKEEPALRERFQNHPAVAEESLRFIRHMGGAAVCILAFQYKHEYSNRQSSIIQSVAAAIENMLLAATGKGIGSCWLTAPLEVALEHKLQTAFAPDKGDLVAMLTLGYAEKVPKTLSRKEGRYIII